MQEQFSVGVVPFLRSLTVTFLRFDFVGAVHSLAGCLRAFHAWLVGKFYHSSSITALMTSVTWSFPVSSCICVVILAFMGMQLEQSIQLVGTDVLNDCILLSSS